MPRVRSFAAPHKGLRLAISKFAELAGYTDFQNPHQLAALKQRGSEMFTLLKDHVQTENNHTLTHLEERAKGSSDHDREDHQKLEVIQDQLEQQLLNFNGNETPDEIHRFYLNFSMFQSQYLEHIYEEETVTELLLQKYFTDEELIDHRISIMQKIPFPVLLLWLKFIIPAQNERESLDMLSGFKAKAPREAMDQVMSSIQVEMDSDRYESLKRKLGFA
jgi:hypothetical protein